MPKYFTVDARTILMLGRDSIRDQTTAVLELVKNAYDADATVVWISIVCKPNDITKHYMQITDNGCGMSERDVEKNWLRIGYSEKIKNTISVNFKRRKTGEKGIGRLSAARLGAELELKTLTEDTDYYGIKVDWDLFANSAGQELSKIRVEEIDDPEFDSHNSEKAVKSGTQLTINQLRDEWTTENVKELKSELSILVSPFDKLSNFKIYLNYDLAKEYNGLITSAFTHNAEIEISAHCSSDGHCSYTISDRDEDGKLDTLDEEHIEWGQLVTRVNENVRNKPVCGDVQVRILYYPRKSDILRGTKFTLSDLRAFLDANAGIKIYRDKVRIKPYGNPEDREFDWLELGARKTRNPAGAARKSFRIAPNQLVGAVFISRDGNENLYDSSSREGLVVNAAFYDLRSFVMGLVFILETHYHEKFLKNKEEQEPSTQARKALDNLADNLKELSQELKGVERHVPPQAARYIKRSLDRITEIRQSVNSARNSISELASQSTVYRTLATIGISGAVFAHETQNAIASLSTTTVAAKGCLTSKPPQVKDAIEELDNAISAADRVAAWGQFALARVNRDKRRRSKHSIGELVLSVIKELEPVFEASSIAVETRKINTRIMSRVFAMDIESLIINLLTNAYSACLNSRRERRISITVTTENIKDTKGVTIEVGDSGPGIPEKIVNRIWEPLFSTKVDRKGASIGTGLGLTIVRDIALENNGSASVGTDETLKGARFKVFIPLHPGSRERS